MRLFLALIATAMAMPAVAAAPASRQDQSRQQPIAFPGLDGLTTAEAVWMLRSGLNVAALSCNEAAIVGNYNAILESHRPFFIAVQSMLILGFTKTYGNSGRANYDKYFTKVYNKFANTTEKTTFCSAAGRISSEVRYLPTELLGRYSIRAIGSLEPGVAQMLTSSRSQLQN